MIKKRDRKKAIVQEPLKEIIPAPQDEVRKKVFELYEPPFTFEHGYVFDKNKNMVSDEGRSLALGTVISRIRGWGRIQYLGTPEMEAERIQDTAGEMIAEALNAYWNSKPKLKVNKEENFIKVPRKYFNRLVGGFLEDAEGKGLRIQDLLRDDRRFGRILKKTDKKEVKQKSTLIRYATERRHKKLIKDFFHTFQGKEVFLEDYCNTEQGCFTAYRPSMVVSVPNQKGLPRTFLKMKTRTGETFETNFREHKTLDEVVSMGYEFCEELGYYLSKDDIEYYRMTQLCKSRGGFDETLEVGI